MIQITFALSVKSSHSGKDIIRLMEQGFVEIYDVMCTKFKQLIEDNVILNCFVMTNENNQVTVSHFATSTKNAQDFISLYFDTVGFWEKYGIDWKSDQREIDFDTVDPETLTLLVDDNVMYGMTLPSIILSPSSALLSRLTTNDK
jgi:hypothetical protein